MLVINLTNLFSLSLHTDTGASPCYIDYTIQSSGTIVRDNSCIENDGLIERLRFLISSFLISNEV